MFPNRTGPFFVPSAGFIVQSPHENLVIICFNEDNNVRHNLAEHPFRKSRKIAFWRLDRCMRIDKHVAGYLCNRLRGTLLQPFLDCTIERTHLVAILNDIVILRHFKHEGAKIY